MSFKNNKSMFSKDNFEDFKSAIDAIVHINDLAWSDFKKEFQKKTIKKGEFIWKEGQTCKHLVFLKNGLVRSFSTTNGKETTHTFYEKKNFFYDDYSFLSQKPCIKAYQVLEDSELVFVSRTHLFSMYDKYKCFERLGRIAIEQTHIKMIHDIEQISQNSSEENYKHLLNTNPSLIHRVPQKIIASYLNVTSEHLSRIRLKISKG